MRFFLFVILSLSLNFCEFESVKNNLEFNIILIVGQSNTHQGVGLDRRFDMSNDEIYQLGRFSLYDHIIIPADEPLHHHTMDEHKIGFGLTFAKEFQKEYKNNPILIIPCGYGSTNLNEDWRKGSILYNDAIDRVSFVKSKYPKSNLKVILFHQGEANVGTQNYSDILDNFIESIRKDTGNKNTPFIVGGLLPSWVKEFPLRNTMQNILKDTPQRNLFCGYADPEIPFIIEKKIDLNDKIHYDAYGQRELGKRYFSEYKKLTSKNVN